MVAEGDPNIPEILRHTAPLAASPTLVRHIPEIPDALHAPLDLALLCLPSKDTPAALEELGRIGAKSAVLIGFDEKPRKSLRAKIRDIAKTYSIALLGPDCPGFIRPASRLAPFILTDPSSRAERTAAPLTPALASAGNVGFFSQSASLAAAFMDMAGERALGFSAFICLGGKAGLDEADILAYLADDPETKVIVGYLESVTSGPRFMRHAHQASRKKPVIILRSGFTAAGTLAAALSGHSFGENLAYAAAFNQSGIIAVSRLEELFTLARCLSVQPLPEGSRVAVVANGTAPAMLAADACQEAGLQLAQLTPESRAAMKNLLPGGASIYNPVDALAVASPAQLVDALRIAANDPNTHALSLVLAPAGPLAAPEALEECARLLAQASGSFGGNGFPAKPVFACLLGGARSRHAQTIIEASGIPCFSFPEPAFEALSAALAFTLWRERPLPVEISYRHDLSRAKSIVREAREQGVSELSGSRAQALLNAFEMPLPQTFFAATSDEAVAHAKNISFPLRLIPEAPGIPQDVLQQLAAEDIQDADSLRRAFLHITSRAARLYPDLAIRGCLAQALPKDLCHARQVSLSLHFRRDPVFGPLIVLSRYNEAKPLSKAALSCRIAPLSLDDARDLARTLVSRPLAAIFQTPGRTPDIVAANNRNTGFTGMDSHDAGPSLEGTTTISSRDDAESAFTELEDILLITSQLALEMPEILEAVCAPVLVAPGRALVLDARFFLTSAETGRSA